MSGIDKMEKEKNEVLISKIKKIVTPNNSEKMKMEEAVKKIEVKISEIDKTIVRVKKKEDEIFEKVTTFEK